MTKFAQPQIKNPLINGVQLKTIRVCGRPYHFTVIDGVEVSIGFADTDPLVTGKPQGWYWDKQGAGTSRTTQTYFEGPEEAFAAALRA